MRDALGGLVNIVIIVVFLVIVSGYLAFNVNYTKAFRVKNKIISTIENNEGIGHNVETDADTMKKISEYMKSIGYNASIPNTFKKETGWVEEHGFVYRRVDSSTNGAVGATDNVSKEYYEVVTFVTVDIPIIKKIMPQFQFFQVKGTTKSIKIR